MKNLFKGFIIGIGKIIPGVSGALLAILLGVYDKSIYYINNFRKNRKESVKYLLPIGIGLILSIILFSKIISYLLNNYYVITMLFFTGLVIGTIPSAMKNVNKKDYVLTILSLIIFTLISTISIKGEYVLKNNIIDIIVLFLSGLCEAVGTVIPGVSSTALLMTIGTYRIIVSTIGDVININNIISNLKILVPFVVGTSIGLIMMIKLISYLFKKYYNKVYAIILGLLFSTIISMSVNAFKYGTPIFNLLIGIVLMFIGIFITSIFDK